MTEPVDMNHDEWLKQEGARPFIAQAGDYQEMAVLARDLERALTEEQVAGLIRCLVNGDL